MRLVQKVLTPDLHIISFGLRKNSSYKEENRYIFVPSMLNIGKMQIPICLTQFMCVFSVINLFFNISGPIGSENWHWSCLCYENSQKDWYGSQRAIGTRQSRTRHPCWGRSHLGGQNVLQLSGERSDWLDQSFIFHSFFILSGLRRWPLQRALDFQYRLQINGFTS